MSRSDGSDNAAVDQEILQKPNPAIQSLTDFLTVSCWFWQSFPRVASPFRTVLPGIAEESFLSNPEIQDVQIVFDVIDILATGNHNKAHLGMPAQKYISFFVFHAA